MKIMSINSMNYMPANTAVANFRKSDFSITDKVSFRSTNLSDDEKCNNLLNAENRFSDFEKKVIKEKLSNFRSVMPKSEVLSNLLAIKSDANEDKKLDILNITNYLNTTSGYYKKEQMAIMDIIDYKFCKQNKNNDEIRESVFSPLRYINNAIFDIAKIYHNDFCEAGDEKVKKQRVLTKTFDIVNNMQKQGINLYPCLPSISHRLMYFPSENYDDAFEKAIVQKSYRTRDIRDIRDYIDSVTSAECRKYIK